MSSATTTGMPTVPCTMAEKIFARASGKPLVQAGEVVWIYPDRVTTPEVSFPAYVKRLRDAGIERFAYPERVVVAIDHEVPVHSKEAAERNRLTRQLARETGVGNLFDGDGITHPLVVERGLVRPLDLVAGADTHTPGMGGVGAIGITFAMELTMILATGRIWAKVPQTIRVEFTGSRSVGVNARDMVMAVMARIPFEEADYRVIELAGDAVRDLSIPERMTLCGLCIDMGAKSAVVEADERTVAFLAERDVTGISAVTADPGCVYHKVITIDVGVLEPQISIPPSPTHVRPVSELVGTPIQHAYIGSCASGSLTDLAAAADLLEGHRVHPDVQLLVIPATRRVQQEAMEQGVLARLLAAGATLSAPTCGPCFGGLAQLAAGESRISTSTRNDPGRMGSREASIFLGSAQTVAASAIAGHIADPRTYLTQNTQGEGRG